MSLFACAVASGCAGHLQKSEVPKPVVAAFAARFPSAMVEAYSKEKHPCGGQDCYEVESTDGGVSKDVIVAADGRIVEVEEGLGLERLPGPVVAAVKNRFPQSTLKRAEKITRGQQTLYEVVFRQGWRTREVVLDGLGQEPPAK